MKRTTKPLIALIAAICLLQLSAADADKGIKRRKQGDMSDFTRIALVIGNAEYGAGSLKNPVNDAKDIAQTLKDLKFDVELKTDCSRQQMETAIRDFGDRLRGEEKVGVFYFSGHGIRVGGRNYLLPTGANIGREDEVPYQAVPADMVLAKMRSADNPLNLVILDACRNNPYGRSWNRGEGDMMLGNMTPPSGTLILYAASPGGVARDGDGANSPFTASLKQWMKNPELDVYRLASTVANDVIRETKGRQRPWMEGMILGDFYFADSGGTVVVTPRPARKEASLSITADVPGATVWINNQRMGGSPPMNFPSIGPGYYRVKVEKSGYDPYEKPVEVEAGQDHAVAAHLEKISAPVAQVSPEPRAREVWREPKTGMEFVWVPQGCYRMGSNDGDSDEKPAHEVCVDGVWMGRTEVTVGQYLQFAEETGSHYPEWLEAGNQYNIKTGSDDYYKKFGDGLTGSNYPIIGVSWHDAVAYGKWLSKQSGYEFRLPSEAEWEYACRSGGKDEKYSGGDDADRVAWHSGNSGGKTHPVGTKEANGLGLSDMSGNVWEWCLDVWDSNAYSKHDRNNPIYAGGNSDIYAGGANRVVRGGSWCDGPANVRCANRSDVSPGGRSYDLGFRLLRTP